MSRWTRLCKYAAIANILAMVLMTALLGRIAALKVSRQIQEGGPADAWVEVDFVVPSLITAMLTLALLRILTDRLKIIFFAINVLLTLNTLYSLFIMSRP